MKLALAVLISITSIGNSIAQTTWASDVAPIFYESCTECHNDNGIGPFSLMDYSSALAETSEIYNVILADEMPPWSADTNYQRYAHERILTAGQRQTILDWYLEGSLEGNPALAPPPPYYSPEGILGTPDLKLTIPTYSSNATATSDDNVCFSLPTNLSDVKKIRAMEIVPGNRNIVHHCIVYYDEDNSFGTDTSGSCLGPFQEKILTGYSPGGIPTIFPNSTTFKSGMTLPAGGNIILSLHYPEGSAGMEDSTSINIYFHSDTNNIREIYTAPILNNNDFCIDPNSIDTVYKDISYNIIGFPEGVTMLSVFPHMHLLGKEIKVWSQTTVQNEIPLINIEDWDFEWQNFYYFDYFKKIPVASSFHARAIYDNTVGNPNNPNSPPDTVCFGYNSNDEMFLVFAQFMRYAVGDELINQDSIFTSMLGLQAPLVQVGESPLVVYPNPFTHSTKLKLDLTISANAQLFIYDSKGHLIKKVHEGKLPAGSTEFKWDGKDLSGNDVPSNLYYYSLSLDGKISAGAIVKH
jgi:hypothetical protein